MDDYTRWLRHHGVPGWTRGKVLPQRWRTPAHDLIGYLRGRRRFPDYFMNLFPWALEHAKRRYMGMGTLFSSDPPQPMPVKKERDIRLVPTPGPRQSESVQPLNTPFVESPRKAGSA
jgi:hypothetical protein